MNNYFYLDSMIECTKCKTPKDKGNFRVRKEAKNGLQYWCKECENIACRERIIPKTPVPRKTAEEISESARNRMLKYRYGITIEQYTEMYERQNGNCAICKDEIDFRSRKTHVDHNHRTNKVRGILCVKCNTGLGKFNDNIKLINNALEYLLEAD